MKGLVITGKGAYHGTIPVKVGLLRRTRRTHVTHKGAGAEAEAGRGALGTMGDTPGVSTACVSYMGGVQYSTVQYRAEPDRTGQDMAGQYTG